jgi:hypothetical protein
MSRNRARRTAAAAVAGGALFALAACGGHDTTGSAENTSSTAAGGAGGTSSGGTVAHAVDALAVVQKRTDAVHSVRTDGTVTVGSTMSTSMKGPMDWAHGILGDVQVTYTGGQAVTALRQAGMPTTMEARYLPDAYYADMGRSFAQHTGGKEWIRYGYDDLSKFTGSSGAVLKDQLNNSSPVRTVGILLASPDVHKVGQETVRGVPATHYAGTIDAATFTRQSAPHVTAAQLASLRQQLAKAGVTTESFDLWVSKDDLPVEVYSRADTKNGVTQSRIFYSDYGVPVHVQAPPAAQTTDFTTLLHQTPASS